MPRAETARYTGVAIALHWAIALFIIALIAIGLLMSNAEASALRDLEIARIALDAAQSPAERAAAEAAIADGQGRLDAVFSIFQMHKTFGLLVLALSLARLAWRLLNPAPPLPAGMSGIERALAKVTHVGFYGLMIGLPLSGWAMTSSSPTGVPTLLFNVLPWPHLPLPVSADLEAAAHEAHELLAYGAIGLIGLHVAAALKHHFVSRDGLLARMAPGLFGSTSGPIAPARGVVLVAAPLLAFAAVPVATGVLGGAERTAPDLGTASVGAWVVDPAASSIRFSGTHTGKPFAGDFARWSADIRFDPENLAGSAVTVTIDTGSAETGNPFYDGSLKETGWLAPQAHPTATYIAESFTDLGAGAYTAEGVLTLKGKSEALPLPFTLAIEGGRARMTATASLDRVAWDVGAAADATGDWVGKTVTIDVAVEATRP